MLKELKYQLVISSHPTMGTDGIWMQMKSLRFFPSISCHLQPSRISLGEIPSCRTQNVSLHSSPEGLLPKAPLSICSASSSPLFSPFFSPPVLSFVPFRSSLGLMDPASQPDSQILEAAPSPLALSNLSLRMVKLSMQTSSLAQWGTPLSIT